MARAVWKAFGQSKGAVSSERSPSGAWSPRRPPSRRTEPMPPETLFGDYVIVRAIGSGRMGTVYRARHRVLHREVALKTVHPRVVEDARIRALFLKEGRAAARLRHPHIADVYDVNKHDGTIYLVMEFLEGGDLEKRLKTGQAMTTAQIAKLFLPLAAALHAAHQQSVIHRHLTPSNVILVQQGLGGREVPKILDFGMSMLVSNLYRDGLTQPGTAPGPLPYLSPEQARGQKHVDARSDQYALGVLLYRCATGCVPFQGASLFDVLRQIVNGRFRSPRDVATDLCPELENLILRSMATSPVERLPSLLEFGGGLLDLADGPTRFEWEPIFGTARPSLLAPVSAPDETASDSADPTTEVDAAPLAAPFGAELRAADPFLSLGHAMYLVGLVCMSAALAISLAFRQMYAREDAAAISPGVPAVVEAAQDAPPRVEAVAAPAKTPRVSLDTAFGPPLPPSSTSVPDPAPVVESGPSKNESERAEVPVEIHPPSPSGTGGEDAPKPPVSSSEPDRGTNGAVIIP